MAEICFPYAEVKPNPVAKIAGIENQIARDFSIPKARWKPKVKGSIASEISTIPGYCVLVTKKTSKEVQNKVEIQAIIAVGTARLG